MADLCHIQNESSLPGVITGQSTCSHTSIMLIHQARSARLIMYLINVKLPNQPDHAAHAAPRGCVIDSLIIARRCFGSSLVEKSTIIPLPTTTS